MPFLGCNNSSADFTPSSSFADKMIVNKMLRGLKFCDSNVLIIGGTHESVRRAVIFLHGSGDSGLGMATWLKQLGFNPDPDSVFIFPSAPLRPYTLAGGEESAVWMIIELIIDTALTQVWHDRRELNIEAWEDRDGIGTMAQSLDKLVSKS